jgi:hypothetical protein
VLILLSAIVALAGCGLFPDFTSPSTKTETFSGTLAPSGSVIFTFTVSDKGDVAVTLTSVNPSATTLGLGVGTASGTTCTVTTSTSAAVPGSSAQLTVAESAGTYCVKVFDVGNLTATATVTVTVAHT